MPQLDLRSGQGVLKRERMLAHLRRLGFTDPTVLHAMAQIPRHEFVAPSLVADAYEDAALPIGEQQTISQPSTVAQMTIALSVTKAHRVLEIGTGSGYQAAILCKLARRLYTIERLGALSVRAVRLLQNLGLHNFSAHVGDGSLGWPVYPGQDPVQFDRIMVTAAGPCIPPALKAQLLPGGVLVMPVGLDPNSQQLIRFTHTKDGSGVEEVLGPTVFVPLIGAQGVSS